MVFFLGYTCIPSYGHKIKFTVSLPSLWLNSQVPVTSHTLGNLVLHAASLFTLNKLQSLLPMHVSVCKGRRETAESGCLREPTSDGEQNPWTYFFSQLKDQQGLNDNSKP